MALQKGLLMALLVLLAPGVSPQDDERIQSFVSAQLLQTWCESNEPLDNEACLSYLRGAFDVLQVARHKNYRALIQHGDGSDAICISNMTPVTQLKIAARRYADDSDGDLALRGAAVFLMQMFRDTYSC